MRAYTAGALVAAAALALTAPAFAAGGEVMKTAAQAAGASAPAMTPAATPAAAAKKPASKLLEVKETKAIAAQPGAVWTAIGDFCGIANWHPAVEKCVLGEDKKRVTRTLTIKGGGTIVEKLGFWNAEGMSYGYAIMSSPLPVSAYRSSITVTPGPKGEGAVVTWIGRFNPAKGSTKQQAVDTIKGVYTSGLESLATKAVAVHGR